MRVAYLDCFAGISGDMFLGALVGAGVPFAVLEEAATAMGVGASLRQRTVLRSGISAIKVDVLEHGELAEDTSTRPEGSHASLPNCAPSPKAEDLLSGGYDQPHAHPHRQPNALRTEADPGPTWQGMDRSLSLILEMIEAAPLPPEIKAFSTRTFHLLGASEAKIHNVDVEDIHFHEVGAVDAIVDIVATCAGVLHLGVDQWHCSPVNVGGGTVRCAHGIFPVPAPATADLLRGIPTYSAHLQKELTTPTGAALLCALSPTFGPQPPMRVSHVGYGAGTRDPEGFANILRLSLGETDEPQPEEQVAVLETALDDATPQLLAYVAEQALAQGALDAMLTPVVMKKGRSGTLVTLLCQPADIPRFEQLLLRETTTLGVRTRLDRRTTLNRWHVPVDTPFGPIRIKVGLKGDEILNAHPEFEDCRRAAEAHAVPLKRVVEAALAAYCNRDPK